MIKSKSYVYCIGEDGGSLVKIGVATDIDMRLTALQTGNGRKLFLVAAIPGSYAEERALRYAWGHLHEHGEWHFDEGQQISRYFKVRETMMDRLNAAGDVPRIAMKVSDDSARLEQKLASESARMEKKLASVSRKADLREKIGKAFVTRAEAAALLRVTPRTVDRMTASGTLVKYKLSKTRSGFRKADIDSHLAQAIVVYPSPAQLQ